MPPPASRSVFARLFKYQLAALLFAWLAALSVVASLVFAGRGVALERGERSTGAFAAVVEQQVARTFQAAHLTLGAVGDTHQIQPRPGKHDPGFQQMMTRRLKDIPFVRALFVVGPDGWIIHDTDYPSTPPVSLADRDYFLDYVKHPDHSGTVWPPTFSRSGTGWFLPVARPLSRSSEFEGVVVAAIQADHFQAQFSRSGLGEGDFIALFHLDGTLVAMHPARSDAVGETFRHLPLFRHLAEGGGAYWSSETMQPGERIVSFRVVEGAPFVVQVARRKDALLAEWRRTATAAAIAMTVLTLILGAFIARLARDRTRRVREREQRTQAEKLEALGQLTAGITHDFGNMLSVVAMNLALLRRGTSDPQVVERALATTERAVRGGLEMIERLMSFARRRPVSITRLRLDEWLARARPLLSQAAGTRVTLKIEDSDSLPEVLCDAAQLDAAVVNLVVNARDATAGAGRISVRAYACDNESGAPKQFSGSPAPFVCLAVRDDGPGMSEAVLRRALEPFYTTKGPAGTGLGLSQVYGFMQQMGGDMTLDSAPGRGTTVHLFFPVASPQQLGQR